MKEDEARPTLEGCETYALEKADSMALRDRASVHTDNERKRRPVHLAFQHLQKGTPSMFPAEETPALFIFLEKKMKKLRG